MSFLRNRKLKNQYPKNHCGKKPKVSWSSDEGKYTITCKVCNKSVKNGVYYFRENKWIALGNLIAIWNSKEN